MLHITIAIAAGPAARVVDGGPAAASPAAPVVVVRLHLDELARGVDPARGNPLLLLLLSRQVVVVVIRLTGRRIEGIDPLLNLRLLLLLLLVGMGMLMLRVATHGWHCRWQWRRII